MIELLSMAASILLSIFTGVVTIATPIIVKSGLKYFEEKTKIMVSESDELKIVRAANNAIQYVEEAAASGLIEKSHKLNTAINMVITNSPIKIGHKEAKEKVITELSRDYSKGATSKKLTT